MMEAVQTSETLVNSYQSTRRYNPENGHLDSAVRAGVTEFLFPVALFPVGTAVKP
jgi:hypothetical protein